MTSKEKESINLYSLVMDPKIKKKSIKYDSFLAHNKNFSLQIQVLRLINAFRDFDVFATCMKI